MSNEPVKLRPHHGMCLAYFAGEGYSGGFTAHMRQVLDVLSPDTPIVLTAGTDTICTACPNNRNGVCTSGDKAANYDQKVLNFCEWKTDTLISFSDFTERIQERILTPGVRSEICPDCEWNGLCTTQPSRWKKNGQK